MAKRSEKSVLWNMYTGWFCLIDWNVGAWQLECGRLRLFIYLFAVLSLIWLFRDDHFSGEIVGSSMPSLDLCGTKGEIDAILVWGVVYAVWG